jgi:shikimate kinase
MLAAHLNQGYVDLDTAIEVATQLSIADIFRLQGEAAFRQRETALLKAHLDRDSAQTIALGGGALVDDELRAYARSRARVVCLWASPKTLAYRIGDGAERPLLDENIEETLAALLHTRSRAYTDVDLVVATDSASPQSVAQSVASALRDQEAA